MAIFILSRREGETAWSYRNRLTGDNAEVTGTGGDRRHALYAQLRKRAVEMVGRWQAAEPNTEFRLMDTGLGNDDRFEQESAPAKHTGRTTRAVAAEPPNFDPPASYFAVNYDCDPIPDQRMDACDFERA